MSVFQELGKDHRKIILVTDPLLEGYWVASFEDDPEIGTGIDVSPREAVNDLFDLIEDDI